MVFALDCISICNNKKKQIVKQYRVQNYAYCAVSEIKSINKYFTLNSFLFRMQCTMGAAAVTLSCRSPIDIYISS